MLLLLLLGAGEQAPVTDGVRAYASTSYSNVTDTVSTQTTITVVSSALALTTNAENSEE